MEKLNSSTPKKAAAARANGRKGGTKNPDVSRWNSVKHTLTAKSLTIHQGKYLPEYPQFLAMKVELLQDLESLGSLSVEECVAVDTFITNAWTQARSFRFQLSETEKPGNGMLSPAMPNLLRYMSLANRQLRESFAWMREIRQRKEAAAAKLLAAAVDDVRGEEQTASAPAAVDMDSQTAPMSAEPLDTTPATSHRADAVEGEQLQESTTLTTLISAPADPGNPSEGTAEEAAHCAAPAEAAQPAQSPAVTPATAVGEEEKVDSPGAG